jgi:hypothetical protein
MPDSVNVAGKQLVLNGMGLREATFLNVHVYVAGLYVERRSSDAEQLIASNQSKQIVLRFVRSVDRGDIVKAWREGFSANARVPMAALQARIDQLDSYMPEKLADGDTLTFTYLPGRGTEVAVNGATKGLIPGDDFGRSLVAIWLGPKPPGKGLKQGLLGGH